MVCETYIKPKQTAQERAKEVRQAVDKLAARLASGQVQVKIGPQGAVAFAGWTEAERGGVSDACAYRKIMMTGSSLARMKIAQAEQMSGRSINRQAVGQGVHSHDGGHTWHPGHK